MGREFKSVIWRSLGFLVMLEMMVAAAIIWWPSFAENMSTIKSLASPIPMLRDMVNSLEAGGISAYVTGQHYFKACNTLGAAAAVLFAVGAVAGEAHRGTLELWLARPVSRTRLLTERYLFGLFALTLPIFASSASIPSLLATVDETMQMSDLMLCSVHSSLFLASIYSVTFLWSTVGSQPTRIAMAVLFLAIFQFAIYMVKTITHYSLFRLVDIEAFVQITSRNQLNWPVVAGMLAANLLCFGAALFAFKRRVP
ncbi:MAG: ABC-2 type transport system permease protein [Chlamydiales bacterium]|jgi:ABC-2 type transport system permease protein